MEPILENKLRTKAKPLWAEEDTHTLSLEKIQIQSGRATADFLARWFSTNRSGSASPSTIYYSARSKFSDNLRIHRTDSSSCQPLIDAPHPLQVGQSKVKDRECGASSSTARAMTDDTPAVVTNTGSSAHRIIGFVSAKDRLKAIPREKLPDVPDSYFIDPNLQLMFYSPQAVSFRPTPVDPALESEKTASAKQTASSSETTCINTHGIGLPGDIVSSTMTSNQMFQRLIKHGCEDLTSLIDPKRYSSCHIAGGGFGDIWKGQLYDGNPVAVKVLRCGFVTCTAEEKKGLKRVLREIYAWSKLDHKNVHKLLGVTIFQGRLGMVSRWMENGNLRTYLGQDKSLDRYRLCIQIARGVTYIHSRGVANILVSVDGVVKLTDFDYAHMSDFSLLFSDTTRLGGGTVRWMAPELVVETTYQRSMETDVYALGMTFLEVITGSSPYHSECKNEAQVVFKLIKKILPSRAPEYFGDHQRGNQMWQLLMKCWDYNPSLRPTAQAVLSCISSL